MNDKVFIQTFSTSSCWYSITSIKIGFRQILPIAFETKRLKFNVEIRFSLLLWLEATRSILAVYHDRNAENLVGVIGFFSALDPSLGFLPFTERSCNFHASFLYNIDRPSRTNVESLFCLFEISLNVVISSCLISNFSTAWKKLYYYSTENILFLKSENTLKVFTSTISSLLFRSLMSNSFWLSINASFVYFIFKTLLSSTAIASSIFCPGRNNIRHQQIQNLS